MKQKNHVLTWRNLFSRWGISSVKYQSQFSNFSDRKFSYFHLHSVLLFEIQRQTAKKLWIHIDCCHHFSDSGNDAAVFVRPPVKSADGCGVSPVWKRCTVKYLYMPKKTKADSQTLSPSKRANTLSTITGKGVHWRKFLLSFWKMPNAVTPATCTISYGAMATSNYSTLGK